MSTTLNSGIDPASFSAVTGPSQDLFRFVNGPWVDMYRLPDDRSRYGSFDKLAEDAENQIRDILEEDDCPAVKSRALYHSFLDVDAPPSKTSWLPSTRPKTRPCSPARLAP